MHHPRRWLVMTTLAVVFLAACQDRPQIPTGADEPTPQSASNAIAGTIGRCAERPAESRSFRLSQKVSAFGGFSFDDDGNLVAYVTDLTQAERVRSALEAVLRERTTEVGKRRGNQVVVRQGQYRFEQLCAWRDLFFDTVLDLDGVVHTGVNQFQNRLNVGILDEVAEERVRSELVRLGVPSEAVLFRRSAPIVPTDTVLYVPYVHSEPVIGSTLSSYRRPLEGGLRTTFRRVGQHPDSAFACTLGFAAVLDDGTRTMIINSHCSERSWDLDQTSYFQDRPGSQRYFGYEYRDPNGSSCGTFSVNVCRWADASAIFVEHDVSSNRGFIARTTSRAQGPFNLGSILIDSSNPNFQIVGTQSWMSGNEQVNVVSWRTGWTYGTVDPNRTCEDLSVSYRSYSKLRCQAFASYTSRRGASGSPVFRWSGGTSVTLAGINWAMTQDSTWGVFSPFGGIQNDLGTLSVIDPNYTPPPPPSSSDPEPCVPEEPYLVCPQ